MDTLDWIKNKKPTINPINKEDNKCFQYAVTAVLNYKEIRNDLQRITKIKPFTAKYNWEGIDYPSEKDNWKKFEKNNLAIALNVLYSKNKKRFPVYPSKHNSKREKQIILPMIPNGEGCHDIAVKKLLGLLR